MNYNTSKDITIILQHFKIKEYLSSRKGKQKDLPKIDKFLSALEAYENDLEEEEESDCSINKVLNSIEMMKDSQEDYELKDEKEKKNEEKFVKLMTVHKSKGLEFEYVLITGVEDGFMPILGCGLEQMEEERRILYVAITRAKKKCFLFYAEKRAENGEERIRKLSRFIEGYEYSELERAVSDLCLKNQRNERSVISLEDEKETIENGGTNQKKNATCFNFHLNSDSESECEGGNSDADDGGFLCRKREKE